MVPVYISQATVSTANPLTQRKIMPLRSIIEADAKKFLSSYIGGTNFTDKLAAHVRKLGLWRHMMAAYHTPKDAHSAFGIATVIFLTELLDPNCVETLRHPITLEHVSVVSHTSQSKLKTFTPHRIISLNNNKHLLRKKTS